MLRRRGGDSSSNNSSEVSPNEVINRANVRQAKPGVVSKLKCLIIGLIVLILSIQIGVPLIFRFVPAVRQQLLFMNFFNIHYGKNLTNVEKEFGLNCTKSFRIESEYGIELGAWHILPSSRINDCSNLNADLSSKLEFKDNRPIFLYLHGNGGTRGSPHRLNMYIKLAYGELDSHILTIDYRGYGDSTNVMPSSIGMSKDALAAYEWLIERVDRKRVTVWGHSMGTAVAVQMLSLLSKDKLPNSLVLEAPFNTVADAVANYPLAKVFLLNPFFEKLIVEPVKNSELTSFNSEAIINDLDLPILILHAADDVIVPLKLGKRLHEKAIEGKRRVGAEPKIVIYEESRGYGHKHIWQDPQLIQRLKGFVYNPSKVNTK